MVTRHRGDEMLNGGDLGARRCSGSEAMRCSTAVGGRKLLLPKRAGRVSVISVGSVRIVVRGQRRRERYPRAGR